ncbi:hypothetical protein M378DRAFT_172407 [Amanita muscaria Koide BX008]|uniref:Uncharacterized protein n=1 Tax=Amanita muscaria (strain Koide BX008) TaxID=946122 RepID=A0A0C2WJB7_AMAMK|nr:hypothetical protein M378DRAFT_172407 [Amanita muscaria Koide BX008]
MPLVSQAPQDNVFRWQQHVYTTSLIYWVLNILLPVPGMATKFEEVDESHYLKRFEMTPSNGSLDKQEGS